MCPAISPNKTVEGSAGGADFVAVITGSPSLRPSRSLDRSSSLGFILLIAVAGQLGDLVESAIKRTTGVKDSGGLLPGHGGVLDRFDSLLFAFFIIHLFRVV